MRMHDAVERSLDRSVTGPVDLAVYDDTVFVRDRGLIVAYETAGVAIEAPLGLKKGN